MGTLFLVATPIGNLGDISARAIETLKTVSLIAAEDTRRTGRLLRHLDIQNKMVSYHDHNKQTVVEELLDVLSEGDVALVSDAGTPGLNDPGFVLVRAAISSGYVVTPVPGPSSPVAALVASGLPTDSFLYLGYLPRKRTERLEMLKTNVMQPHTLIFLETPHRLLSALEDLGTIFGDREMTVAREITKLHEEFIRGRVSEIQVHFQKTPPRGELTLVISGAQADTARWSKAALVARIHQGLENQEAASSIAKNLATESGWSRREIYLLVQQVHDEEQ